MNTKLQSDVTTPQEIPTRHHSKRLVVAVSAWDSFLDENGIGGASRDQDALLDQLNNIIAEAAFLGFPQTVKLARTVKLAFQHTSNNPISDDVKCLTLNRALRVLKRIVIDESCRDAAQLSDLVRDLQTDFKISDHDITKPFDLKMNASPAELTTGTNGKQGFEEHRDLDVYRNSRLDSLDQCFEEESWIVSQLASLAEDLASGTHCSHPASRLMHVLKNHKLFNQVDRVCLVGRVAGANQLVVVDASMSARCPENSLKKGYSCFVNPEGSLFKMRPGTVRMFGDCERVLSSFAAQGKPAQRSIALISDLGLRSGLCLALGRGSEVQGFLFLNSVQEDLFREISIQSSPILSLFGLIATITLDTHGFHPLPKNHPNRNDNMPKSSTLFEPVRFKTLLEQALSVRNRPGNRFEIELRAKQEATSFLYLPTTIINSLAELISRVHTGCIKIGIDVAIATGEVQLSFDHGFGNGDAHVRSWLSRIVQSLDADFSNKPVTIKLTESQIAVAFPYEPLLAGHQGLLYSTVY